MPARTITVSLSYQDVAIICVALSDLLAANGEEAWPHPTVERLRRKLAEAIAEQVREAA